MSAAHRLAAELSQHGVTAGPAGNSVRAWVGGTGSGWVLIVPGRCGDHKVWSWQHNGNAASHPREDMTGAASALARFLHADPALTRPTPGGRSW